jgi:membrane associated rhomboid family serine protease
MALSDRDYYRPGGFGGFSFFPPVIKNLLIINGAVFLLMLIMQNMSFDGMSAEDIIFRWFALMPLGHGFEVWQLISYQFLHGGFTHILFNMFALWMFGAEIENILGSRKFLLFYLLCGIGGGLLHLFLSPVLSTQLAPTIGASGAVFGVMIAFALMFPNRLIFIYFLIPVKAKYLIFFLVLIEVFSVDSSMKGVDSSIAHLAHIGGALTGLIFILLDKDIHVALKDMFRTTKKSSTFFGSGYGPSTFSNPFAKKDKQVEDANYYDINNKEEEITQEEIDRILDKIAATGYQNLSEKEKKILFEASKRIK